MEAVDTGPLPSTSVEIIFEIDPETSCMVQRLETFFLRVSYERYHSCKRMSVNAKELSSGTSNHLLSSWVAEVAIAAYLHSLVLADLQLQAANP